MQLETLYQQTREGTGCDAFKQMVQVMKHFSKVTKGTLKVDLQLVSSTEGDFDVANAEFSKTGNVEKKNTTNGMKVAVEGKCIFDTIVKRCGMTFPRCQNSSLDWRTPIK